MAQSIEISTIQGLTTAIDGLTTKINALDQTGQRLPRGSGKALEEFRKTVIGLSNSGNGLTGLASGLTSLNATMNNLSRTLEVNSRTIIQVFADLPNQIAESLSKAKIVAGSGMAAVGTATKTAADKAAADVAGAAETLRKAQEAADRKLVAAATNRAEGSFTRYSPSTGLKGAQVTLDDSKAYALNLRAMAQNQATEDARYAALRKDSLERGKVLIVKAVRDRTKAELDALKDAERSLTNSERSSLAGIRKTVSAATNMADGSFTKYNARTGAKGAEVIMDDSKAYQLTLQAMAQNKTAEDARYAALRKDSLARGSVVIVQAAKDRAKAEREALKIIEDAEKARTKGSFLLMQGTAGNISAERMGAFTPLPKGYFNAPAAPKAPKESPIAQLGALPKNLSSGIMRKLGDDMGYAHSAARGLASGFDMLYLTWGKLLPLLGGASISYAVRKTFDVGSEVEYNIEFLRLMGNMSKESSKVVREELRKINAESIFTLTELSSAMVALGQAGRSPADSLKMLKPISDLATAGMVDLKTAYTLVNQAQKLYNLDVKDTPKLVSQLVKITQSGTLNVEDLAGSFKYASESNTRFGQSIESTLAQLGALADAGLKGPAGGTAYINFLRDIAGRSGPAIKALQELREKSGMALEVFNKNGTLKDAGLVIGQLGDAFKKLSGPEFQSIIQRLTSDRGSRDLFAALRQAPGDLQKMVQELEKVDVNLAAMQAKGLLETTKGQLEQFKSNLSNTLDEVFAVNVASFQAFFKGLQAAVTSSDFKLALHGIVQGFTSLVLWVQENFNWISKLTVSYLAFRAAAMAGNVLNSIAQGLAAIVPLLTTNVRAWSMSTAATVANTQSLIANGVAVTAQVAAQRALAMGVTATAAASTGLATASGAAAAGLGARGLLGVVGLLSHPLVAVITILGTLGAAWYTMSGSGQSASDSLTDKILSNGKLNIDQLNKELLLLRERKALVGEDISDDMGGPRKALYAQREKAKADLLKAESQLNTPGLEAGVKAPLNARVTALKAKVDQLGKDYKTLVDTGHESWENSELSRIARNRKARDKQQSAMADIQAAIAGNVGTPGTTTPGGGSGNDFAKELERYAKEFDRMTLKAKDYTAAEAKLQEMLGSDAYKSARADMQKMLLAKANGAIAAEKDTAATKLENENRFKLSEQLRANASAYNDLLNAREEAAYESQVVVNGIKSEVDALKEQLDLKEKLRGMGSGPAGEYAKAMARNEFELKKKHKDQRSKLDQTFSDVAGLPEHLVFDDEKPRWNDWANQSAQLDKTQITETALTSADIWKDAWDGAITDMSKKFVDGMMDGTLDIKEFLLDSFANMVLRPQLELLVNKGMEALFGGALSFLGLPSFDGGGNTGNGPRSGGLDGKGGYMAMLHPQETVIDHTKGQSGGGAPVYVTINQTVGDIATKSMLQEAQQATVRQVQAGVARSMRYRGAMSNG